MESRTPLMFRYTRFEKRVGFVRACASFVHTEEVNGEDTIEFECLVELTKGDRLLWRDDVGTWHEHIVVRMEMGLNGVCSVYAENSACEMIGDYIEEKVVEEGDVNDWLKLVMGPCRWKRQCTLSDTPKMTGYFYHTNVLAALHRVASTFGGELTFKVHVDDMGVVSRTVVLEQTRGTWRGARFTYGKNLAACVKTVQDDDVVTALYGYGAGLPRRDDEGALTGGYTRKVTFGSVNGGLNYITNESARLRWGRWNSDKTEKKHFFGEVTFPKVQSPKRVLALTKLELARLSEPQVTYVVDAALLDEGPRVYLGDSVAIIDTEFEPEWRVMKRVMRRVATYTDSISVRLTIGTVDKSLYRAVAKEPDNLVEDEYEKGLKARCLLVDGERLVFTYLDNSKDPYGGVVKEIYDVPATAFNQLTDVPWYRGTTGRANNNYVTEVVIHSSFADAGITKIAYWFYGFNNLLKASGFGNLGRVTTMRYTFNGCNSLVSVDLTGMRSSKLTDLYYAFGGCSSLTTIYASEGWALPSEMESTYATFYNCSKLVGGNGTVCDGSVGAMKGTFMVIDTEETPGYLTAR